MKCTTAKICGVSSSAKALPPRREFEDRASPSEPRHDPLPSVGSTPPVEVQCQMESLQLATIAETQPNTVLTQSALRRHAQAQISSFSDAESWSLRLRQAKQIEMALISLGVHLDHKLCQMLHQQALDMDPLYSGHIPLTNCTPTIIHKSELSLLYGSGAEFSQTYTDRASTLGLDYYIEEGSYEPTDGLCRIVLTSEKKGGSLKHARGVDRIRLDLTEIGSQFSLAENPGAIAETTLL